MISVGITGGIGSGKSTICRIFAALGIPIYDSDSKAKELMSHDTSLISGIKHLLGHESYISGEINRQYIAAKIFGNEKLLNDMNALVHPAVGRDFDKWCKEKEEQGAEYVIIESAILFESCIREFVDRSVTVSAPEELRAVRAAKRDKLRPEDIRSRIQNQMTDGQREDMADYTIRNDERELVIPQVIKLHKKFCDESRR